MAARLHSQPAILALSSWRSRRLRPPSQRRRPRSWPTRLRGVRAEGTEERGVYELRLAGVRNVKSAKALLADYEDDVGKLREGEP